MLTVSKVFFPLDKQLELRDRHWSEGLTKLAVWLAGLVDFAQAAEILERVGGMVISSTSVWRRVQTWGEHFCELAEADRLQGKVVSGPRKKPGRVASDARRLGVGMDGSLIHIREEGWKEIKVGSVFELETGPTLDEGTGDMVDLAHAVHNSYVVHLGGPEVFGDMLWAEARRRQWEEAPDSQVIGDGAPWVWNLAATHFYGSHQVVDWYHATEHLATAVQLTHGDSAADTKRVFKAWEEMLFQGHAQQLATKLYALADNHPSETAGDIRREAGYFANNCRRMNYLQLRSEEWVIGSGMVESGGKQFKARLAGPGMRWSRPGAERLLPIRAAIMSDRFDELWQRAYRLPPN